MISFIDEVANHILGSSKKLSEITLIFPSKRAGSFFRKALLKKLGNTTTILPQTLSIEELIINISGLVPASTTQLQVELFFIYTQSHQDKEQDSFLEFLGWGQTLLGDFNEIDRHMIPTKEFFDYLSAIKELNHWSVDSQTKLISGYLNFWKNISLYYTAFKDHLETKGQGYQGMIYRKAAEEAGNFINSNENHFIFCGFNALNTAEQQIIDKFLQSGKADIFWDIDPFFLEDKKHVAGNFIRSHLKKWYNHKAKNTVFPEGISNFNSQKSIHSTGISQNIGQVKYVGQLLEKLNEEELAQTAVILGDEALLLPLLNSLPENVKALNVTMGLPLSQVTETAFFESWFTLQTNAKEKGYFYKDVLAFLSQNYCQYLLKSDVEKLKKHIRLNNIIYLDFDTIQTLCDPEKEELEILFSPWVNDSQIALSSIVKAIYRIKDILMPGQNWLQLEYLYKFLELFNQLKNLSESYSCLRDLPSLKQFYKELLQQETIDFRGDPYTGLQVMGVLESRVLDFKNVIITSLNEGTFPSGKSQNSFIPFDLKMEYKLPTYREKDAIYAYHFFRILQRATNVNLIFNNEAGGLNAGEKSRFLMQLAIERDVNYSYVENSASAATTLKTKKQKRISKNPDITAKLKKQAASGFSPSALSTYIRNPLDFYYKYVLRINESEDVEEIIAHNTLGTVVHQTLEELYKPFLNCILTSEILHRMLKSIDEEVEKQFEKEYNLSNIRTGKNLIIYNVAKQFVHNFLRKELEEIESGNQVQITHLEYKTRVLLNSPEGSKIYLRGTVDRIDKFNETTRIIDYKTGRVESRHLKLTDWDLLISDYDKQAKAFQVLCYALMLQKDGRLSENSEAGIISFKNLGSGFIKFSEDKQTAITAELLQTFETYLNKLISEIMDISVPFSEKEV